MPDYRLIMRSVSGEFETGPWGHVQDWGRSVTVASLDDIHTVQRLVITPGGDRRAVIFERLTNSDRQTLIDAISATGLVLRPFDDDDKAVASDRLTWTERLVVLGVLVLSSPYLLIMRVRGRTTRIYEVTRTPAGGALPPSEV